MQRPNIVLISCFLWSSLFLCLAVTSLAANKATTHAPNKATTHAPAASKISTQRVTPKAATTCAALRCKNGANCVEAAVKGESFCNCTGAWYGPACDVALPAGVWPGLRLWGHDESFADVGTPAECVSKCVADKHCKAMTYSTITCYLFHKIAKITFEQTPINKWSSWFKDCRPKDACY